MMGGMRKFWRWLTWSPERAFREACEELEARAFTAPNGKRYVTWDRERSRAQIFTPPQ